ncbi:serine hydrolase [Ureibacillus acetophenoni]|uniref:serine hydrolase n=1 Tax=Ureibacillus acetophenoni TaxID=614649 RepID=UPI0038B5015D
MGGAPGVVAMVKDRVGNIYEGFAAVRDLNTKTQMTTESVFSLFSTTKAITGAALMKLHD